jgi:hypothetical protein
MNHIMKKIALVIMVGILLGSLAAEAQQPMRGNESETYGRYMMPGHMRGMMNPMMDPTYGYMMGMMYPMYGNMTGTYYWEMPMMRVMGVVGLLPDLKDELSLSESQTHKLLDIQSEYRKQLVDYQSDLVKKRMTLNELITENAPSGEVREQLQACAEINTSMRVAAYETAENMKAELDEGQREQLDDIISQRQQNSMRYYRGMMQQYMGAE